MVVTPILSVAQESSHSMKIEVAAADLQDYSFMDGHKLLFEYQRHEERLINLVIGFSVSRTINEVMSYDPEIINSPEKIREGYQGVSLDFFTGFSLDLFSNANFSLPIGFGLTPRIRTESYPDPDSDTRTEFFRIDENGDRIYVVMTETIYKETFDMGLYGTLSADYSIWDNWELSLQNRYQVYTGGFSILSTGVAMRYFF